MSKAHLMAPIKGLPRPQTHLLLWVEERVYRGRAKPGVRHAWLGRDDNMPNGWQFIGDWDTVGQLDLRIDTAMPPKGQLTIWLARGWEDLVLTGLTEMLDNGTIEHRYAAIDGARVLIRGQWRHRGLIVTSLGNWYGSNWRHAVDWESVPAMRAVADKSAESADSLGHSVRTEERAALQAVSSIFATCYALQTGSVKPTVGAQALSLWKAWLGPRVHKKGETIGRGKNKKVLPGQAYVCPLPSRPDFARQAERHACYALETRQFATGYYDNRVYAVDLHGAYLLGLLTTPLPCQYVHSDYNMPVESLAKELQGRTGCALVLLDSPDRAWPCRRGRSVEMSVGTYWTWLAGCELAAALCNGYVKQVHVAHLWSAITYTRGQSETILSIPLALNQTDTRPAYVLWRLLYSSLVGRMAAWRRVWEPARTRHHFGRWSTWLQADHNTGEVIPWRSIAGKVECMVGRRDTSDSVPLLYAVVTARVRYVMRQLMELAGKDGAMFVRSDELWLTHEGYRQLAAHAADHGMLPDDLPVKATYYRAWLTGKSLAVVEDEDGQHIIGPGIPADIAADDNGRVQWPVVEDWTASNTPQARRGVGKRASGASAKRIVSGHQYPLRWLPLATSRMDAGLPDSLLQPLSYGGKSDENR